MPEAAKPEWRVLLGDCIEQLSFLGPESIDFVFADPPYHLSNGGFSVSSGKQVSVNKGDWDVSAGFEADLEFHLTWLSACKRVMKPNATLAVSGTHHSIYRCGVALEILGFKVLNDITWYKPNAAPHLSGRRLAASHETVIWAARDEGSKHVFNYQELKDADFPKDFLKRQGKQMRDVWAISTAGVSEKEFGKHPTQKPLLLLERLVQMASLPGQWVLDPFAGSGTTGVASLKLGRNFIGVDLEPEFIELMKRRLGELND